MIHQPSAPLGIIDDFQFHQKAVVGMGLQMCIRDRCVEHCEELPLNRHRDFELWRYYWRDSGRHSGYVPP